MYSHEPADVLAHLRTEWQRLGRSPAARRSLGRLRVESGPVVPSHVVDLVGLVGVLEPRGGLDAVERSRIVTALLVAADDPMLRRCLLQTLIPGIVSVARALRFGEGVADDPRTFLADTLTEAVELLRDWAGQRRLYAAGDLLAALRCRVRRRMLADKARRTELRPMPERGRADDDGSLVDDLARAAVAGVTDVDLVYARCVLGYTASELAHACGVTSGVLRRRLATAARTYVATPS